MDHNYIYEVFVSHNKKQKNWVRKFVEILRQLGISTFFDEDEIKPGDNFINEVHNNIQKSKKLVVVLTPESVKSKWVKTELNAKLYYDPDGSDGTIIPVLLKPVKENEIPASIRTIQYADLTDRSKSQAAWENLLKRLGADYQVLPEMPDLEDSEIRLNTVTPTPIHFITPIQVSGSPRKIAIIGMGYVGLSLAVILANAGHNIIGIEEKKLKVDRLQRGESHLLEPGIDELLRKVHLSNKIRVTRELDTDQASAVEFAIVCLGPTKRNESGKDVWHISTFKKVLEQIGEAVRNRRSLTPLNVIISATVRPQDCEQRVLEGYLNRLHGNGFLIATNPLFCREGSMLNDLQNPPFIITGTFDGKPNRASREWSEILLNIVDSNKRDKCQVHCMTTGMASMVKLTSNTFHAIKVCFANEVGRICHERGIDAREMMSFFTQDSILNISNLYLQPGFAFGGSCLGKDIHGLQSTAENYSKDTFPLIGSIQASNNEHIAQAALIIESLAQKTEQNNIGFFGLTFKPGTDDLRYSPAIEVIKRLPRQCEILAIDSDLEQTPDLTGKNREEWIKVLEKYKIKIANNIDEIISNCLILVIAKSSAVPTEKLEPLLNQHWVVNLTGEVITFTSGDIPSVYSIV